MRRGRTMAFAGALALAGFGGVVGCANRATKMPLSVSQQMPAARGQVELKPSDGPANKLTVEVKHLAEPFRANSGASVYVVWLTPAGSETPINVGTLSVDKDLTGRLETSTPYRSFQIMVTPEATASVTEPSNEQVMQAQIHAGQRAVR
jgi:hypothetical protein